MILLTDILLIAISLAILTAILQFALQCIAAALPARRRNRAAETATPTIAVLIPAHDEESVVGSTIEAVLAQLGDKDRLIVVADNCGDDTAAVAQRAGATVIQRHDDRRRGKGYALAYGIDHLRNEPPDVVVFIDADTVPETGAVARLAGDAMATGRPAQAVYLLDPPPQPSLRDRISSFAVLVKNMVRPLGLARLHLPCQLTGTGIAIAWPIAADMSLRGECIVEDMQLGIDLAIAGHPPQLCPDARMTGRLPQSRDAAVSQRKRWEHGHVQMLLKQAPRLLVEAFKQRRVDLLAMGLDLAVPPLSLLCLAWLTATGAAVLATMLGASYWPLVNLGAGAVILSAATSLAWARYGRQSMPLRAILAIPFYVAWKIPICLAFIFKRQTAWLRTPRDKGMDPSVEKANR